LGCADSLGDFSLCYASGCTRFEKFVKELKLFVQLIVFSFYIRTLKCANFKFFVS